MIELSVYDEINNIDKENINQKENIQKHNLVTIDELIQENTEKIFRDLNDKAREAFALGQLNFVYYIPYILWDTEEFIEELKENMALSGWTFGEIETFRYGDEKKKKIRFIFCEESK